MADRFFSPRFDWTDGDGRIVPGGTLTFYEAGSSTPKPVYSTAAADVALSNPVVLNAAGFAPALFGTGAYKVVFARANGEEIWTEDNMRFSPETPIGVESGGTGGTTAEEARANLGLGTAAVYDVGVAPGNVVVVQTGGQIDPSLVPTDVLGARSPAENLFLLRNLR